MDVTIREMTGDDVARVCELLRDCYRWLAEREGFNAEQLAFLIDERSSERTVREESKTRSHLVACLNGGIVGMAVVHGKEIARLYVDPQCHRRGVGRALFEACEGMVRGAGYQEVVLGAMVASAEAFYRAMGMHAIGRKEYEPGIFDDREVTLMAKDLRQASGSS